MTASTNIIELPCKPQALHFIREQLAVRATRYGASDAKRRKAFGIALRTIRAGSSTAWALQSATQFLRANSIVVRTFDPKGAA